MVVFLSRKYLIEFLVYFAASLEKTYFYQCTESRIQKHNFRSKKICEEKIVSLFGRKNRNKLTVNSKNHAVSISSLLLFWTEKQCERLNKVLCVHCANNVWWICKKIQMMKKNFQFFSFDLPLKKACFRKKK